MQYEYVQKQGQQHTRAFEHILGTFREGQQRKEGPES